MCDIAPLIRSSFAEELQLQRAVLKKATVLSQKNALPSLRSVPRGTQPPMVEEEENTTDVRTQPVKPLPSVESGPIDDDPESKELTFRVIPKTPPRGAQKIAVKTPAPPVEPATTPEVVRPRGPKRPSGPIPRSAPEANHDRLRRVSDTTATATESGSASIRFEPVQPSHHVGLMLAVAILGAGLAATMTFLYYGKGGRAVSQAPAIAVPAQPAVAEAAQPKAESPAEPVPASADENQKEQARILAANTTRPVVVTALDSDAAGTGTLSIRSSQPATIYLYPDKTVLGTTPLLNIKLPVGEHKLKAQTGSGKGQRKYFHVKVEAGVAAERSFDHWSRSKRPRSKQSRAKAGPAQEEPAATPDQTQ
jgi:hypothetical protein